MGCGVAAGFGLRLRLFLRDGCLPFLALVPFGAGGRDGLDRLDEVALELRVVAARCGDGHGFGDGFAARFAGGGGHPLDEDVDGAADAGGFAFGAHDGEVAERDGRVDVAAPGEAVVVDFEVGSHVGGFLAFRVSVEAALVICAAGFRAPFES